MQKSKALFIIVVLLVIVNCVLIGSVWYINYYPREAFAGRADVFLIRTLQLNSSQQQQYEQLRNQHHEFTQGEQNMQRMQRDSFFDYLKQPGVSHVQIASLQKRMLISQSKLDSATFYHFYALRKILNHSQQKIFDKVIGQVIHHMSQQRPGPPARPGDQLGPPPQGPPEGLQPNGPPLGGPPPPQ